MNRFRFVCSVARNFVVLISPLFALCIVSPAPAATPELPFYENFEPLSGGGTGYWDFKAEWHALETSFNSECYPTPTMDYCPDDPGLPSASFGWGPLKFESWPDVDNGGRVFSGQRSGRQPIFDPYWVSMYHVFTPSATAGDLRAKAMVWDYADILCDCDQAAQPSTYTCDCETLETNPPPRPNRANFDVNGWLFFSTPDRSEYFILGVNSHESWDHYVWCTATDGWNVTDVPRAQGWYKWEIVVHPYTGNVGDVEFLIDGVVVAQGNRAIGGGNGVDPVWLRVGAEPAVIAESTLANTFEEFWYDEVALTFCEGNPRVDTDADGDVDQEDFAVFQRCLTGPGDPFTWNEDFDGTACQCVDIDGDKDVDVDDFDVFQACGSGPGVLADPNCDD